MSNTKKGSKASAQHPANKRQPRETATDQRLEKAADEMADAAAATEKRYDEEHGIFTK